MSSAISVYSLSGTATFISGVSQVYRIGEGVKNYMFDSYSIMVGKIGQIKIKNVEYVQ